MDSYNLTHTGAELDSAIGRALQGFAAADAATEAANNAAQAAEDIVADVQEKLDNGEFMGPVGPSGVYVGSGDMPEGYSVQVDPTGDMLCYTAGESDDRYANVLTGTASGPVAGMEDVSPTGALRRAAVLGATAETGEGDKSPDNPYTLAGVQPTSLTVCGKNLCPPTFYQGAYTTQAESRIRSEIIPIVPHVQYVFSVAAGYAALNVYFLGANKVGLGWLQSANNTAAQLRFTPNKDTYRYAVLVVSYPDQTTPIAPDAPISAQLEFGTAATPYTPYAGQTVPLPALAPLYGDGTVCDEYDAATGVENRRWKRVTLDGTENRLVSSSGVWTSFFYTRPLPDMRRPLDNSQMAAYSISHYNKSSWNAVTTGRLGGYSAIGQGGELGLNFAGTLDEANAWLAAQYAAGTPVTVVYQLDAPAVTRHDPARILPPAPVCRVFADAGGVDVGYNRDINIAFEQQQAEYIAQIKALDARIAKLETGQPAEPMT